MPRWMSVTEVAEYLGLKPSTIYAYVSERRIPHYKRGHLVRFREDEIDAWMNETRVQTNAEQLAEQIQKKE